MADILVIDDEPLIADDLCELIREQDYSGSAIYKVYNYIDALQILNEKNIRVVLLDINMPGKTGLELQQIINEKWPFCKIIFLTGYSKFEYIQQALHNRASDYILKNEGDEKILQAISRALNEQAAEDNRDLPLHQVDPITDHDALNQIMEHIDLHLNSDLSLVNLSGMVHMNPSYFSRLFHEKMEQTFSSYIAEKKIEMASAFLLDESIAIKDIASMVGFWSPASFSKFFKKKLSISPRKFRESHLSKEP